MGSEPKTLHRKMRSIWLLIGLVLVVSLCNSVTAVDCGGEVCKTCLGSCDGCSNCPLCKFTADMCNRGRKLEIQGSDICAKCKYCDQGTQACFDTCEEGHQRPECIECREKCE